MYIDPTMMHRIWSMPEKVSKSYDLTTQVAIWHHAAPCPSWLKEAFIDWLGADVIWEMYGGTEGLGTTMISGGEWLNHRGSVGKPRTSCQMKILDDRGCELPPNTIGEVFILPTSGAGSKYRYVGAKSKRNEAGWESLGDMGYMDAEGYLYLTDRQTDMILSGGANIYPAEVEAAIEAFPGVRSCAVVGLPHDDLGNQVHAIVDAPTGGITQEALLEHLSQRLVRYKIPRSFEFVDQPLRDEAGKLQRHALRSARIASRISAQTDPRASEMRGFFLVAQDRDGVDLNESIRMDELRHFNHCRGWKMILREEFQTRLVDFAEFGNIADEHRHLDDVRHLSARPIEPCFDVF